MIVEGDHLFAAPPATIWGLLLDPDVISRAMPGKTELQREAEGEYRGRMRVTVGPITAAEFALKVVVSDPDPPSRFTLGVDATGRFGFTRGEARVSLEPDDEGTRMRYHADLQMGGKIASVGQRLLDVTSRAMLRAGLGSLTREVDRRLESGS